MLKANSRYSGATLTQHIHAKVFRVALKDNLLTKHTTLIRSSSITKLALRATKQSNY